MARLFLTKVWGFDPEIYPALGFNSVGARRNFLRASAPGDWVIFSGTLGHETNLEDQGRLLGKVQLGPEEIDVEQTLRSVGYNIPKNQYNPDGKYKWPFGLPIISALRFSGKPRLVDVLGSNLSGSHWATFALDVAEKLGDEAQAKLEALPSETARVVEAPGIIRQLARQRVFLLNGGVTGPGPSPSRSGSTRVLGEASVYRLELQGAGARDVFKIGFSKDVDVRLGSHNVLRIRVGRDTNGTSDGREAATQFCVELSRVRATWSLSNQVGAMRRAERWGRGKKTERLSESCSAKGIRSQPQKAGFLWTWTECGVAGERNFPRQWGRQEKQA